MAAAFGESLEFKHPVDIGEAWKETLCTDCHTGLNP
jgi:RNase P subunit RPR2